MINKVALALTVLIGAGLFYAGDGTLFVPVVAAAILFIPLNFFATLMNISLRA